MRRVMAWDNFVSFGALHRQAPDPRMGRHLARIRACSRLFLFCGKTTFWIFGSPPIESGLAQGCFSLKMTFLDSGSPPIESGPAQGCFFP